MSRIRRRAHVKGLAFMLGVLAAALTPLLAPAAESQAATCTMTHSKDSFAGRARESHFWVNVPERGTPVTTQQYVDRGPVGTGPMNLDIYTCKRDGVWELEAVYVDDNYADLIVSQTFKDGKRRVTAKPQKGRTGYGVFVRQVRSQGLLVAPRKCAAEAHRITWLGVVKGVTGLPLPLPHKYAVGAYVANALLPDSGDAEYYCGDIDSLARVPLKIGPKGGAQVGIPDGERLYIGERVTSYEDAGHCNYRAYVSCKRYDKSVMWVINR